MRKSAGLLLLLLLSVTAAAAFDVPRWGDAYWRDSLPQSMRQSYVAFGERYLQKPWNSLPASVFSEYKKQGNRTRYEALIFEKRRQLAALVMAEVAEGKKRFLPDIVDGLLSTMEETWWGLPAHYRTELPRIEDQNVDLFNAETASLVAYTRYLLAEPLDGFSPLLTRRIDQEVQRRMLKPAVSGKYSWKTAGNNWNPWICSNWAACIEFCEHDSLRRQEALRQIEHACQCFVDAYPADGGCDEGPHYWDRAAASLFETLYLVHTAQFPSHNSHLHSHNSHSPADSWNKLLAMEAYIYKMYIPGGYAVNFADSHGCRSLLNVNIAYPFGLLTGDKVMCRHAAFVGMQQDVLHRAADVYDRSGNWPSLGREIIFLSHIQEFLREQPVEASLSNTWLPDLQIMTVNTKKPSPITHSLFVAFKGGTNGESHNHNDVGSFIVYPDGEPLLIDPGTGEYTAQTFSRRRYEIWTMQSAYHNLPVINGCQQRDGKQYRATVVSHRPGRLTLDIAAAYPKEAKVRRWNRTVAADGRQTVSVTEDFQLDSLCGQTVLHFVTPVAPDVSTDGRVLLGSHSISYDHRQLQATAEDISNLLDPMLRSMWGDRLFRISLVVRKPLLKGRIKYSIQ